MNTDFKFDEAKIAENQRKRLAREHKQFIGTLTAIAVFSVGALNHHVWKIGILDAIFDVVSFVYVTLSTILSLGLLGAIGVAFAVAVHRNETKSFKKLFIESYRGWVPSWRYISAWTIPLFVYLSGHPVAAGVLFTMTMMLVIFNITAQKVANR